VLTDPPIAVKATAGGAFTVPVATIHTTVQQATAGDFTATLAWGDGQTSNGTLQPQGGGTFEVFGSHTYANPGSYRIAITLSDNHGNSVSDSTTATVAAPLAPPSVTVTAVQPLLNQRGLVTRILVTLSAPVDGNEAQGLSLYHVTAAGKGGSLTARDAKVIKLRSAVYDSAANSVILTPNKPFALTKRVELRVAGTSPMTLELGSGGLISGSATGHSKRIAVTVAPRRGATRGAVALGPPGSHNSADASSVDALLAQDQLSGLTSSLHAKRGLHSAHRRG
jgi:hypothetical protein